MSARKHIVFTNARIHTMDPRLPQATWFSVQGKRLQRVGVGEISSSDHIVDLKGATVVPGFVDAHMHFFQAGMDLVMPSMAGASSLEEMHRRLQEVSGGPRSWVFASGFEEDVVEGVNFVTRAHLDGMQAERPVWINRVDYHSAIVNSAALRRLNIPIGTPGLVVEEGKPNGILRSEAYFMAKARIVRQYPVEAKERAIRAMTQACLRRGITAVHALEGGRAFGDEGVTMMLKRIDAMPLDVTLYLQEKNVLFTSRLGFERLGGCIMIDGSIGSYTAALEDPYEAQPHHRGVLYEKTRELSSFIEEAHRSGIQLAFHAIGPRAIDMVLAAYERALMKHPRFDHRHRIEHFELATDAQIAKVAELGVIPCMQPNFEYLWGGPSGMYASRLGERWRRTNRFRSILDAGACIAGGSDANVTPADPLFGMHAAINHPNPEQRITPFEALRMMTRDAAYAAGNERRHGTLEMGKDANFVVLEEDPFSVAPERIKDIAVLETWFQGRCVYDGRSDEVLAG